MAFQTGTRVDPRLLDYSGYAQGMANAAQIQAAALADLGARVGSQVEKYYENKKEKELKQSTISSIESLIKSNPEFAKTLNVTKAPMDTGEVDESGNPIFTIGFEEGAVKAAATEAYNVLGQEASTAFVGASYLKALEGDEEVITGGGITNATEFKEYIKIDNPNYDFKKEKGTGRTIIVKRDIDGKFKPVTDPNDEIFMLTDNPKAYFAMYKPSDSQGLYR